jgi:hypothetical protein
MARPNRQPKQKRTGDGFGASTVALALLWVATTVAVVVAHELRPAAPMTVTLVASNVGFDVLTGSRQLLLGDVDLDSFTVAAFESLVPTFRSPGVASVSMRPAGVGSASLTVKPARLETITAPGDAHVVVNWSAEEPDAVRLSVSRQPAHGGFAVPDTARIRCNGCGPSIDTNDVSAFEWTGRAESGGTTLLLRRDLTNPLRLSQDDIAVQGSLDTTAPAGTQRVSTIKEGTLQLLNIDRSERLSVASRLIVEQIEPGTGRLKDLAVTKNGIQVTLEAKVGRLGVVEAGRFDNRLPSWLELGFRNQAWLYFTQGVVLVGGTASKLLAFIRQRRDKSGGGDA